MEKILVYVKDKEKAQILFELLSALDFVDSVNTSGVEEEVKNTPPDEPADFFSLAGLWEGRDITLDAIRQKAWPRQRP